MTNVSKAMKYATTFEREAMREKLDAAIEQSDYALNMEFKRREWVGLTDEDIKDIVGRNDSGDIGAYTRKLFKQIEDKLRERNT
jgi:hypothetical protein